MELYVNGKLKNLPTETKTILDVVRHFDLEHKHVIIEHNESIIQKDDYPLTTLSDRDAIEIVHFVGGG
ncbi:MAG TPA: sulfur carrier protein ThiS [Massilibacterium sp.]|nr:sulfur carrier protein ThiS [Massilibacterium sp.]